jgi:hypothetical protein
VIAPGQLGRGADLNVFRPKYFLHPPFHALLDELDQNVLGAVEY